MKNRPQHVIPVNDLVEHEARTTCVCRPKWKLYNGLCWIIVHNSLDGREATERRDNP